MAATLVVAVVGLSIASVHATDARTPGKSARLAFETYWDDGANILAPYAVVRHELVLSDKITSLWSSDSPGVIKVALKRFHSSSELAHASATPAHVKSGPVAVSTWVTLPREPTGRYTLCAAQAAAAPYAQARSCLNFYWGNQYEGALGPLGTEAQLASPASVELFFDLGTATDARGVPFKRCLLQFLVTVGPVSLRNGRFSVTRSGKVLDTNAFQTDKYRLKITGATTASKVAGKYSLQISECGQESGSYTLPRHGFAGTRIG